MCSESEKCLRVLIIGCGRAEFPLKGVGSCCAVRNVVSARAFMSSTPATEAFQGTTGSSAYGSDQIQVNYLVFTQLRIQNYYSLLVYIMQFFLYFEIDK